MRPVIGTERGSEQYVRLAADSDPRHGAKRSRGGAFQVGTAAWRPEEHECAGSRAGRATPAFEPAGNRGVWRRDRHLQHKRDQRPGSEDSVASSSAKLASSLELDPLKSAARAAIVMPAVFALAHKVIGQPRTSIFATFGSFAMLVLVEFTGTGRSRPAGIFRVGMCGRRVHHARNPLLENECIAARAMAAVGFGTPCSGEINGSLLRPAPLSDTFRRTRFGARLR